MQSTLRALTRNGGALTKSAFVAPRGIHTSTVSTVTKVGLCREKGELLSNNDINSFRNISTGAVSNASFTTTKLSTTQINPPNLGPRAKAGFNTSIARQDLGFLPFESSIIFPNMELNVKMSEIKVPYLPDNFHPVRPAEPEIKVSRPIIATVSDTITHIAAPSAIMEGMNVSFMFSGEQESLSAEEDIRMLRAFKGM